jgi:hypothetical protein
MRIVLISLTYLCNVLYSWLFDNGEAFVVVFDRCFTLLVLLVRVVFCLSVTIKCTV